MRPVYYNLSAVASTPWIPLNWEQNPPVWDAIAYLSEDAAITYSVQVTYDGMGQDQQVQCSITRAAGVATVTFPFQHGMSAGDTLLVQGSGSTQLDSQPFAQQIGPPWTSNINQPVPWTVATTPSPTTLTYACANAGPVVDAGFTRALLLRVFPVIAGLTGATTRQVAPVAYPVTGVRLINTIATAGFSQLQVLQGSGR